MVLFKLLHEKPDVPFPVIGYEYSTGQFCGYFIAYNTANQSAQQLQRAPKVDRPILTDNITEEYWNAFMQSWNFFIRDVAMGVMEQFW